MTQKQTQPNYYDKLKAGLTIEDLILLNRLRGVAI